MKTVRRFEFISFVSVVQVKVCEQAYIGNVTTGLEHLMTRFSPWGSSSSVCSGLVCCWVASSPPISPRKGSDDWGTSWCEAPVGASELVTSSRSVHRVTTACSEYGQGFLPIIDVSISLSRWGNTTWRQQNTIVDTTFCRNNEFVSCFLFMLWISYF
jgi:hypothetical protein